MLTKFVAAIAALAFVAASPSLAAQTKASKQGALAKQDQRYFRDMAQDNMAEVQTGKLAQQRARSDEVKKFADRMVEDHGKMLEEQRTMAKSRNMQMPKAPNKEQQAALKKLQGAKGEQFETAYMSEMVKDHERTVKLLEEAAQKVEDSELKAMVEKATPVIEEHLKMAKEISDKAAAGGTAASGKDK